MVSVGKITQCATIRCRNHAKQARYKVEFYEAENLLIVRCLLCPPGEEVVRAPLAKKGCPYCLGGKTDA